MKKEVRKLRLPQGVQEKLKKGGGAHKSKKDYNRQKVKQEERKLLKKYE